MNLSEYEIVANEFLNNYGQISSNILNFCKIVAPRLLPVLLVSCACSIVITFFHNLVK